MALFKSVKEHRDKLYYNKYKFKFVFHFKHARYLTWYKNAVECYKHILNIAVKKKITHVDIDLNLIDYYYAIDRTKCSTRIEGEYVTLYSNDIDCFNPFTNNIGTLYEITVVSPVGTMYFKRQPKHKYRIYLKGRLVTHELKKELSEFLNARPNFHPGPGIKYWISIKHSYFTGNHYFIDHDLDSDYLLFSLIFNDLVHSRVELVKLP